jgi:hypothetical protein
MDSFDVTIPFVDIINTIIILEKDKHYKESESLAKDVVRSYSGDYNMLESDINEIFVGGSKNIIKISETYPEEYIILKKVFGALIWSD